MGEKYSFLITLIYLGMVLLFCFAPLLEYVDFESLDLPWDYARITDVDYTAKVIDEPGKRWISSCY